MSSIHRTLILLIGFALAGCDQGTDPTITAPSIRPPRPLPVPVTEFLTAPNDVQSVAAPATDAKQSVTGHYQFVGINTGNDFKYSLSAIRHHDGSISGEFEERVVLNATGDFIRQTHGTVTCFEIVGNMARIGGLVDQATDPRFLPGTEFRLVVVDNGEAASDPPDLGSNARFGFPGTAQAFCDAGTPFNLEPVEHGNVEVRP